MNKYLLNFIVTFCAVNFITPFSKQTQAQNLPNSTIVFGNNAAQFDHTETDFAFETRTDISQLEVVANASSEAIYLYVNKYKGIAIQEMQTNGIPASIKLAQGLFESRYGTSQLATLGNNHFGIKCRSKEWTGETLYYTDDRPNECFRKYKNAEQSFKDHSYILKNRKWYEPLFKLNITDYKAWAQGLQKAGYATDPLYATKIISIIEKFKLYEYDRMSIPKQPKYNNAQPMIFADNVPSIYRDNTVIYTQRCISNYDKYIQPNYAKAQPKKNVPTTQWNEVEKVLALNNNKQYATRTKAQSPKEYYVTPKKDHCYNLPMRDGINNNLTYTPPPAIYQDPNDEQQSLTALSAADLKKMILNVKDNSLHKPKPVKKATQEINDTKCVTYSYETNITEIAKIFKIDEEKLKKYNDISTKIFTFAPATNIFLEAKKTKPQADQKSHTIRNSQTMWQVAQQYGIQLEVLLKINNLQNGEEPANNETITLRGKTTSKPKIRK